MMTPAPVGDHQHDEQDILHLTLSGLLPEGHVLALHRRRGTLARLSTGSSGPRMHGEQQFPPSELSVLVPPLENYPGFCPYEVLLASFTVSSGNVTQSMIERYRKRLYAAREEGCWDQEMRPVRNVLSRVRLKVRQLGIEIISVYELGYALLPYPVSRQRRKKSTGSAQEGVSL